MSFMGGNTAQCFLTLENWLNYAYASEHFVPFPFVGDLPHDTETKREGDTTDEAIAEPQEEPGRLCRELC